MKPSAEELIRQCLGGRLNTRPEFYAGRGNRTGDLDSKKLELLHAGIKRNIGVGAAKSFVRMVESLSEDASATTFLLALYRMERNDWQFRSEKAPRGQIESTATVIGDALREDARGAKAIALAGVANLLHGRGGETPASYITGPFLRDHKAEMTDAGSRRLSAVRLYGDRMGF